MNSLRLHYKAEDEQHGELLATVESGEFRGQGAAWFPVERLREFWRMAGAYPITEGDEPNLTGGFWDDRGETVTQCHLGVSLSPHDLLGSIRVRITLGTPAPRGEDADLHQTVTVRFCTSYVDIDRFRVAFAAMLEGQAGEATLEGTHI